MRERRQHTPEFKAEILALCQQGQRSTAQIAKDFNLARSLIQRWKREALGAPPQSPSAAHGPLSPDERQELQRLRREIAQLRMDRDILKKAAAFFANESK